MSVVVWISGASSGIGAAFLEGVQKHYPGARAIAISRRPPRIGEHLPADLGDPRSWDRVEKHLDEVLDTHSLDEALFFHCAGTVDANGPICDADPTAYRHAVLVNSAAGQVIGRAFLVATATRAIRATLIICSSPGASLTVPGMSHYCAGKAALEHWTRSIAAEIGDDGARVFSVVPYEVDTPMVRGIMAQDETGLPLAGWFREADARGALATAEETATHIWQALKRGVPQGEAVPIGAVDQANAASGS